MSHHTVPANNGRKRSIDSSSPNTSRSHGNSSHHSNRQSSHYHGHNHHNHHKRSKHYSGNNQTTLESIVDYIFGLPSLDHIVIEFRAGRKSPKGYASFITEEDFSSIYRYIRKAAKTSHHSEYIYERGRYLHSRLITDDSGMVTSGVYKERLASFDIATNLNHDIRVDILKETPIVPLPVCPEEGYMFERKKHKYTVETKDWHLDLLHVLTNSPCSPSDSHRPVASPDAEADELSSPSSTVSTTSYEIEAQIKLASMRNVPDKKAGVDLFENVFVEVHNLLARLSSHGPQVFPDLKLERVSLHDRLHYLKTQFLQVVPNVNTHNHRFPGSLPQGLERSKIKYLQKGDYWISEKSDGVRYLLLIVDRNCYLIDRRMDFYHIHKFPLMVELFGNGVTLLDGEMVRNLRTGKLMYLIFDILALNGQMSIGTYNLSERLGIIGKKVVTVFRDKVKEKGKDYAGKLQFTLSGKIFRPKHLIKELATMIKHNERGERLFVDDKRCHRNDGLIFTPTGPYLPYSSSHLMKWKYCDRLTIDFLFKFTDEGHEALVGQGGDVMVNWPDFDMAPADWDKLTSSLAKTKDPSKAVIECAFNHETQKWMFNTLRPDKDRPNHITTVQHTLFIVNENITLEELVYRVPIKTEADDWEENHPEIFAKKESEIESVDTPISISSSVEFTPPTIDNESNSESDSDSDSESSDSDSDSESSESSDSESSDSNSESESESEHSVAIQVNPGNERAALERAALEDSDSMDSVEEDPTVQQMPPSPISALLASPLLNSSPDELYEVEVVDGVEHI